MRQRILVLAIWIMVGGCGARPAAAPPIGAPDAVRLESSSDKRAAFARAYDLFRRGQREPALALFAALAERYPELADYHLYFVGVISVSSGDDHAAQVAFERLRHDYPQSVKADAAAVELGKLLSRAGRADAARPLLQAALAAADSATVQAARLALAEADEHAGDRAAAYAGFMTVRRRAAGAALGHAAKQHVQALRTAHPELIPVGADRLDEARLLLTERDYAAAESLAEQILASPDAAEPAAVLRVRADALYGQGSVDAALAVLRDIVDRYPQSTVAPPALFKQASVLWNRDNDQAALAAFEEFRRRYARHTRAAEALYAAGRIHYGAGRSAVAIATFQELARQYARSTLAPEALWRIGWIHYLAHNWTAAASTFARAATRRVSGQQRDEATYWQARALERAGRRSAARDFYQAIIDREPTGYYALWAERRLAISSSAPLGTLTVPSGPIAVAAPVASGFAFTAPPAGDPFHWERWSELRAAGVFGLAREELAAVARASRDDAAVSRSLLGAYQTVDGYAAALRLLRRRGRRLDLSPFEREHLFYPLAFWTAVSREAQAHAVDPLLVLAVMRQESLFDPAARSPADARGLLQLLPATAQRLARSSGGSADDLDLMQPEINIQLGAAYLNALLARFGGDVLKAVAAYNGGEAAVERWERRAPDLEPDEFVESISFRETRDYVKHVVSNYRKYQRLYGAN